MPEATGKSWYLVQCRPRQDTRALEHLERQGYQCLLPTYDIERLQKGKLQLLNEPLFPGYLFIHLDKIDDNWLPIRSTRGVQQIVSFGGRPVPVADAVIERVLHRTNITTPALVMGDHVLLDVSGSQPIEAIFLARNGSERVLLLLRLLQRELIVSSPLIFLERSAT
ncbi:transcription/translation regulatory transformer protein RfaH [Pseudomonas citronellolis]|uniref:transcription/translation regulatory transformer protein RfaH n=1 Tax=Pseudomonas citronellolis TaxID=53408 RepID=UPI0021C018C2|nr:transcription/translation regulatory transformer protein RfaH [Pseudomonas citronellolis]MDN6871696.1 transcription/translation regulatory transformer protein RfaH [Pseudomonas citronellolis]UXJ54180.1 transcription/translation regulatory transformer protein RfaH [Pseudomonas citronellolis]WBG65985.1 transcription/translation regulatory transformer protein RfaH [Pseudomonas citronellolis]